MALFPWEQCVCVTDNNVLSSQAHWRSAPWDYTQRVLCATCELLACRIGAADPGSCPWVLIIQQSVGLWWGELLSPAPPKLTLLLHLLPSSHPPCSLPRFFFFLPSWASLT